MSQASPVLASLALVVLLGAASSCDSPGRDLADAEVAVTTSAASYGVAETIRVTLRNGLSSAITTLDQQAQCTVVRLERAEGGAWVPVLGCTLGTPSREVTVGPGTVTEVALAPHPSQPDARPTPGRYRVALVYTVGPQFRPADPTTDTTTSAPFTVE